ncbi:MAG: carbonate dehydratase [Gammaproteobacteria bacterium]|nr:carbonate dehydratase [Gammaproteobacteria bacterium]
MSSLTNLLNLNREWSESVHAAEPDFFEKLRQQQRPKYLWVGCSDSRVPANQIVGLLPGELFVHRNVANLVIHTDLNCLSVLQYAVDVLQVEHVIVCGHYGCGGVEAALTRKPFGLIDNWLRHIQDLLIAYKPQMDAVSAEDQLDRLCELNVVSQAANICRTTIVQSAWQRGQQISVHAWVYRLTDGLLHDLDFCVDAENDTEKSYEAAAAKLFAAPSSR